MMSSPDRTSSGKAGRRVWVRGVRHNPLLLGGSDYVCRENLPKHDLEVSPMRFPKPRVTVRGMMVAVAILALASLAGREGWRWWLRRGERNPVQLSQLSAGPIGRSEETLVPGRPVPVPITYDFRLSSPKPPTGTTIVLWASVWFEDSRTGLYVDGYTFDAPLIVGERESTSGTFDWDALIPHPGRYHLRSELHYSTPSSELKFFKGGGSSYHFAEAEPVSQPGGGPGDPP
jgi:hypothetical protein